MENAPDIHLNPAEQLPPVGCPLLIEVDGQLLKVERREWVLTRSDTPTFYLPDGGLIRGWYRWTYP